MKRNKLIEQGHTWEEAEDILSRQAEDNADAERDRKMEELLAGLPIYDNTPYKDQ